MHLVLTQEWLKCRKSISSRKSIPWIKFAVGCLAGWKRRSRRMGRNPNARLCTRVHLDLTRSLIKSSVSEFPLPRSFLRYPCDGRTGRQMEWDSLIFIASELSNSLSEESQAHNTQTQTDLNTGFLFMTQVVDCDQCKKKFSLRRIKNLQNILFCCN